MKPTLLSSAPPPAVVDDEDLDGAVMKNNALREAGAVEPTGTYAAPAFMIPNIEATASPDFRIQMPTRIARLNPQPEQAVPYSIRQMGQLAVADAATFGFLDRDVIWKP